MRTSLAIPLVASTLLSGAVLGIGGPLAAQAPTAASTQPAPPSARFDHEVRTDFFTGFAGNAERLARGMARTEEVLAAQPDHAEALVWHGSGLLFKAGQAFQAGDTAAGMETFGRGLGEMNKAVALAPDSVGVRVPRGATLFESTRFMAPAQAEPLLRLALSDYERALALQSSTFASLGEHARGELLFGLADGYARVGDQVKARTYFDRMTREGGPSPRRDYATAWLAGSAPARVPSCGPCHAK
jgi:hypothetical protein